MILQTVLKGRLRITSLTKGHGLMPVFVAAINFIRSSEEHGSCVRDWMFLRINRATRESLNFDARYCTNRYSRGTVSTFYRFSPITLKLTYTATFS